MSKDIDIDYAKTVLNDVLRAMPFMYSKMYMNGEYINACPTAEMDEKGNEE